MMDRIRQYYKDSSLATKIRYSYMLLLVPLFVLSMYCFFHLWVGNKSFEGMINSTMVASDFSLDFKKDFDYETYLLIVGHKSIEEAELHGMLSQANQIVDILESQANTADNDKRLESVKKYLKNLADYVLRIEENLRIGNRYEENIQIWENDVQIVTTLVQNTIYQYTYYEIRSLQASRDAYQNSYISTIRSVIIAFIILFFIVLLISFMIPLSITRPITELSQVMDRVAKGDLEVRSDFNNGAEVSVLSESLNTMIDKINELLEQVTTEQVRLRKAEFELLQAQINPHFLYNTLDAIVWLAEAGEQKQVVSMVGSLSDFFRGSLNQGKDVVSIKDELQHIRSYLAIQQVRYQDILQYDIQVPEELYVYQIPKITLQPLVENALYHGIKNKRGQGKIEVIGRKEGNHFFIDVKDNGIGMDEKTLHEVDFAMTEDAPDDTKAFGLYNINERIRLRFGDGYGIHIESAYGEGTKVEVCLPCTETIQASES